MRNLLSKLIVQAAINDPKVIVLAADHGYSFFDELRKERPDQFLNCGIAEQGMIGIAAGMARQGYKVIVYGLASFIPMRTLEQIKLDVCFSSLPIIFIGDGAGLVYSHLGASHQCAEDLAVLTPLPHMRVYSLGSKKEVERFFSLALQSDGPTYIRVGKSHDLEPLGNHPQQGHTYQWGIVTHGSMCVPASKISAELGIPWISVPSIKPLPGDLKHKLRHISSVFVIEEHSKHGGLYSAILDATNNRGMKMPYNIIPMTLDDKFSDKSGSYEYALSEHQMDYPNLLRRIKDMIYHEA